jgi:sec-independent protein translocase protein TatB
MFDIGWSELVLIGVVALIAIGPKELPGALRALGQWTGKLRRMASEFQSQFQEAMREAEMADLKKQVDEMTSQAQSYTNFDPIADVRKEFESTQQQIETAINVDPTSAAVRPEPASAAAPAAAEPAVAAIPDAGAAPASAEPAVIGADTVARDAGGRPA